MMYPFAIVFGLMQATALAVVGYFILFAASRSQGLLKHLGNILGAWLMAIALIVLLASAFSPLLPGRVGGYGMMGGRPGWMHPLVQPPTAPAEPTP